MIAELSTMAVPDTMLIVEVASLGADRSRWRRVRLGAVVRASREDVTPEGSDLERYVAGEHMVGGDLRIRRWGTIGENYLGPAFHRRFRQGQVLFGSRRPYLRKVAVADFDGVCANTTLVLEASTDDLLPELLPFILTCDPFYQYAVNAQRGSVNPYVNWSELAQYEFELPPLDEQRRIAEVLWILTDTINVHHAAQMSSMVLRKALIENYITKFEAQHELTPLSELIAPGRPITYGIVKAGPDTEGGVRVVAVKDYPHGDVRSDGLTKTSTIIDAEYERSRLRTGDILLSIRGTIGRVAQVEEWLDGANISRDSARIAICSDHNAEFFRHLLESEYIQKQIVHSTLGLAVQGINLADIRKLKVPVPPRADQDNVVAVVRQTTYAATDMGRHLNRLRLLKKTLLSRLIDGDDYVQRG